MTLRDGQGYAQVLYPTFGDLTALLNTLRKIDAGYTVQANNGSVTATLGGRTFSLIPGWELFEAKLDNLGSSYWTGGPQFMLRLDNYSAQGVSVK